MSDLTRILTQIDAGDPSAAEQLLPLIYDELRNLVKAKLAQEQPGQTLQATALVHEAYLRLVGQMDGAKERQSEGETIQNERPSVSPSLPPSVPTFHSRGHFFGAAAEAMRRILVERARQKRSLKEGGGRQRVELNDVAATADGETLDLLALDEALTQLEAAQPRQAELIKLRFFAGLTNAQAAEVLGISATTADNDWAYAKTWLKLRMSAD